MKHEDETDKYKRFINTFAHLTHLPENYIFSRINDKKINNTCFRAQNILFEKNNKVDVIVPKEHLDSIKSTKVRIILNSQGKRVINDWINASIEMYNLANTLLYSKVKNLDPREKNMFPTTYYNIRKELENKKYEIINRRTIHPLWPHSLDLSISEAFTNFKESFTRKAKKIHWNNKLLVTTIGEIIKLFDRLTDRIEKCTDLEIEVQKMNDKQKSSKSFLRKMALIKYLNDEIDKDYESYNKKRASATRLNELLGIRLNKFNTEGVMGMKDVNGSKSILWLESSSLGKKSNINKFIFKIIGDHKKPAGFKDNKYNVANLGITKQSFLQKSKNYYYLFIPVHNPKEAIDIPCKEEDLDVLPEEDLGVLPEEDLGVLPEEDLGVLPGDDLDVLPGDDLDVLPGDDLDVLLGDDLDVLTGDDTNILPEEAIEVLTEDDINVLHEEDIVPEEENINVITKEEYISLDLGARKFFTAYGNGYILKIGEGMDNMIRFNLYRQDRLDKAIKNDKRVYISKKQKYKLRQKRINNKKKYERKLHNKVTEMHWKAANFLTNNFNNILIGDMSVQSCISKEGTLEATTKRVMSKLRFYQFKQKVQNRCKLRNVGYSEVNERYTSKLCSGCGNINPNLGGSEYFECPHIGCGLQIDRDVNSARNILIRHLCEPKIIKPKKIKTKKNKTKSIATIESIQLISLN